MAQIFEPEVTQSKRPSPPYVAYPSFVNMLSGFKEHGLPARVDRSVLSNFSGVVGGQLLTALRFLYLIEGLNHPTPRLKAMVDALGTDKWTGTLSEVIEHAFKPLFNIDLATASPSQFNETFKREYPGEGSTLRKTMTFFLSAAKDAQLAISPYIMKNKKPRATTGKKPTPKAPARPDEKVEETKGRVDRDPPKVTPAKTPYEVLMGDIYDPMKMSKEEEQAVFALARFLKKQELRS